MEELDVVALTIDRPDLGLKAGNVGAIVHKHSDSAFEVEFVDQDGWTYGWHTLPSDQLLKLLHQQAA